MQNLKHSHILRDDVAKIRYLILSHRPLSDAEASSAVTKVSLHREIGSVVIPGCGQYKTIEVIAADGWEDAK